MTVSTILYTFPQLSWEKTKALNYKLPLKKKTFTISSRILLNLLDDKKGASSLIYQTHKMIG